MAKPTREQIEQVFDYWVATVRPKSPVPPRLLDKREVKIRLAIQNYGVETCLRAIDGVLLSPWHMGKNPRQKKYDDIELILRNATQIEKFATIAIEAEEASDAAEAFVKGL